MFHSLLCEHMFHPCVQSAHALPHTWPFHPASHLRPDPVQYAHIHVRAIHTGTQCSAHATPFCFNVDLHMHSPESQATARSSVHMRKI